MCVNTDVWDASPSCPSRFFTVTVSRCVPRQQPHQLGKEMRVRCKNQTEYKENENETRGRSRVKEESETVGNERSWGGERGRKSAKAVLSWKLAGIWRPKQECKLVYPPRVWWNWITRGEEKSEGMIKKGRAMYDWGRKETVTTVKVTY